MNDASELFQKELSAYRVERLPGICFFICPNNTKVVATIVDTKFMNPKESVPAY